MKIRNNIKEKVVEKCYCLKHVLHWRIHFKCWSVFFMLFINSDDHFLKDGTWKLIGRQVHQCERCVELWCCPLGDVLFWRAPLGVVLLQRGTLLLLLFSCFYFRQCKRRTGSYSAIVSFFDAQANSCYGGGETEGLLGVPWLDTPRSKVLGMIVLLRVLSVSIDWSFWVTVVYHAVQLFPSENLAHVPCLAW